MSLRVQSFGHKNGRAWKPSPAFNLCKETGGRAANSICAKKWAVACHYKLPCVNGRLILRRLLLKAQKINGSLLFLLFCLTSTGVFML